MAVTKNPKPGAKMQLRNIVTAAVQMISEKKDVANFPWKDRMTATVEEAFNIGKLVGSGQLAVEDDTSPKGRKA